jgi:hypothetical protein
MNLCLMPILAGQHIVHKRSAISAQSPLAVFAESSCGVVGVVVTDQGEFSFLIKMFERSNV